MNLREKLQTVIETGVYLRNADRVLGEHERAGIVDYLARYPEAGDLIQGGGGVRKVRFAANGEGKSGGVRVIYYYHDEDVPLFLMNVYSKGDRADLSQADIRALAKLAKMLPDVFGG